MGSQASTARRRSRATSRPRSRADREAREILDCIRQVVRVLRLTARLAERRLGISGAQLFVLEQLLGSPVGSLEELAARTLTDQSSVSVVVRKLMEQGLVERQGSPDDRRRVALELTRKGRALAQRAPETGQARLIEALHHLSSPARRSLSKGLAALVQELEPVHKPTPMFFENEHPSLRTSRKPHRVRT